MILFEATTGSIGESYIRCYVWAASLDEATQLAKTKCLYDSDFKHLQLKELFKDTTESFCTEMSDSGWESEERNVDESV